MLAKHINKNNIFKNVINKYNINYKYNNFISIKNLKFTTIDRKCINTSNPVIPSTSTNSLTHEGLPRFGNLTSSTGILRSLDYIGTLVFSCSGSLTALLCGSDLWGALIIGTFTAVGGGTLRDVLILNKKPFWFEEWEYLILGILAAGITFLYWNKLDHKNSLGFKNEVGGEGSIMDYLDALSLGAFAVIGTMNGIRANAPILVCCICGMMTCTFGGLTRDTLLNRPVRILHPYSDMYAPIAFAGSATYLALRSLMPQTQGLRIFLTIATVVGLRIGAMKEGWRLPWWNEQQEIVWGNSDPRLNKRL